MSAVKTRASKPVLLLLYGFPGAGKTHFARNFTDHLECAHLHSDKIRHEVFDVPRYDEQEDTIVDHLMNYMTEEFLNAGISVVYDMNAMRKSQRFDLRTIAHKHHASTLVIWFQIDSDTAYERLRKRDRRKADDRYAQEYTPADFKFIASRMQHPEITEDYVVVSGKHTFTSQKSATFVKLLEMGVVSNTATQNSMVKPGLVNLIPNSKPSSGRVDFTRRNINIR